VMLPVMVTVVLRLGNWALVPAVAVQPVAG
jgi:hypothetical protein